MIRDCLTYALAERTGHPVLCVGDDFAATDIALVTDDMVLATTLIGTEDMVAPGCGRGRRGHNPPLPGRRHPDRRLDTLARGIDLVRSL